MKVSEVMSKAVVVDDSISIKEAAKIMSDKNIGSLIIIKNDKIAGIITERDVIKNISKSAEKILLIMSKKVISINQNESIDNASDLMAKNKVKKLPVLNNGKLVGIITATDVIGHSKQLNQDFFFN